MDDMSAYPYNLLNMEAYIKGIKKKKVSRYFEINSSRGCPYKCPLCECGFFCVSIVDHEKTFRDSGSGQ